MAKIIGLYLLKTESARLLSPSWFFMSFRSWPEQNALPWPDIITTLTFSSFPAFFNASINSALSSSFKRIKNVRPVQRYVANSVFHLKNYCVVHTLYL